MASNEIAPVGPSFRTSKNYSKAWVNIRTESYIKFDIHFHIQQNLYISHKCKLNFSNKLLENSFTNLIFFVCTQCKNKFKYIVASLVFSPSLIITIIAMRQNMHCLKLILSLINSNIIGKTLVFQ